MNLLFASMEFSVIVFYITPAPNKPNKMTHKYKSRIKKPKIMCLFAQIICFTLRIYLCTFIDKGVYCHELFF